MNKAPHNYRHAEGTDARHVADLALAAYLVVMGSKLASPPIVPQGSYQLFVFAEDVSMDMIDDFYQGAPASAQPYASQLAQLKKMLAVAKAAAARPWQK